MSSYWWPLGRANAAPATSPAPPQASVGPSGAEAASSSSTRSATATSATDVRHLAQAAFHTSLENLLVEATKHRSLLLLRDAVQDTRQRHYDPMSLFDTLCIACLLLAERSGSSGVTRSASSAAHAAAENALEGARKMLGSGGSIGNVSHSTAGNENSRLAASLASLPQPVGSAGVATADNHHFPSPGSSHAPFYHHHGAARNLLLQSIGDVGKLVALGLLPVTLAVGQRVANLVREIAFMPSASSVQPVHSPYTAPNLSTASTRPYASRSMATTTAQFSSYALSPSEKGLASPSDISATVAAAAESAESTAAPVRLVNDDPVLVRLLQLTASAASACPLSSPALPELYGVLLVFYSGVAPQSMLEATCEATLTHHIHTVLAALRDGRETGSDNVGTVQSSSSGGGASANFTRGDAPTSSAASSSSPFTAQLQSTAFIKDICRLMMGARTRWLNLSAQRCSSSSNNTAGGSADATTTASPRSISGPHKVASVSSSMAAVTASVVAAAADAERQQQQQQQQSRSSQGASLTSTPMTTAIAPVNRDALAGSFGSPFAVSGGNGGVLDSPSTPAVAATAVAMECAPERLRAFLMRAVTLFFKEQGTASSSSTAAAASPAPKWSAVKADHDAAGAALNDSPLYVQCLNDCLFSVALWGMYEMDITVLMQPPPSLFVEAMQQQYYTASHSNFICSLDLFTCTQQLALVTVSSNLAIMSNSAQVLMEAHERLLRRLYRKQTMGESARSQVPGDPSDNNNRDCGGHSMDVLDAYAERLSQAAIAVLTLWRKTLACSSLLWELQQLRSAARISAVGAAAAAAADVRSPSILMMAPSLAAVGAVAASSPFFDDHFHDSGSTSDDASATQEYDSDSDEDGDTQRQRTEGAQPAEVGKGRDRQQSASIDSSTDNNNNNMSHDPQRAAARATGASGHKEGRFRHHPQLLTLVRPQTAYLDAENSIDEDDDGSRNATMFDSVGSPRLEAAPLARLLISVLNLTMAYMQTPPRAAAPSKKRHVPRRTPVVPFCVGAAPPTIYHCLTEAVNFMTVFGQYFCQLAEQEGAGKELARRRRWCSTWFLDLHPQLVHCSALCLRHLRYEEDVLPVVLKGIGYWVQISCALRLTEQRDAYLSLLVRALRTPDPVVGHLIALSPPTSSVSGLTSAAESAAAAAGSGGASSTTPKAAVAVLEALLALHKHYAAREPIVPGSVAAAVLDGESVGDFRDPSPSRRGGRGSSRNVAAAASVTASGLSGWGIGWLRHSGRVSASSGDRAANVTSPPRAGSSAQSRVHATSSSPAAANGGDEQDPRTSPLSTAAAAAPSSLSAAASAASAAAPLTATLISLGWRAPAVQHVVVLGVCRLQHKILIMKTLHVIANALGAELDGGWALLARGTALTEPLLHMLKRLLSWIEETSVEQEQQEQLLSDALHLRDALRSLCVDNTCRLPYAQLNLFFSGLVNGTAALSPSAPEVKKAAGIALSGHSWSAGFGGEDEAELNTGVALPLDDLYDLTETSSPYTVTYAHLPRHDPQGCADQWVLTSECLCLSLLAMLPFTEQHGGDPSAAATVSPSPSGPAEAAVLRSGNNNSSGSAMSSVLDGGAGATAVQLQQQRAGALMRALRLWQLETDICRYVVDAQRVVSWGTTLVTCAAAHRRVLLTCSAEARHAQPPRSVGDGRLNSDAMTTPPLPFSSLPKEDVRLAEFTLTVIVGHVAAVAAHLCRSAARRRSAAERKNANNNSNSSLPSQSYQAIQSAALTMSAGPFAVVPLIQAANALFAAPAGTPSPMVSSNAVQPPQGNSNNSSSNSSGVRGAPSLPPCLLPFVQADAKLSTAAILYGLQRTVQATSTLNARAAAHHRGVCDYGSPTGTPQATSNALMDSPVRDVLMSGAAAGHRTLEPTEQLLASPFALLEDIYQQWTQPQCVAAALQHTIKSSKDVLSRDEEEAPPPPSASKEGLRQQQQQQQQGENTVMAHSIDDSPLMSPVSQFGSSVPEMAAAATLVAEAVPQLLMSAATSVLTDVVKVIQAYGEDIDGAAWEPILSLLQRTATLATAPLLSSAHAGAEVRVSGGGGGGAREKAKSEGVGSGVSAQMIESLNTAFRALESIQHNHIPRLKVEGLHRLIICIGAFTVHRVDAGVPGERKLHINLSAVQLLWSTADYLAAFGGTNTAGSGNSSSGGGGDAETPQNASEAAVAADEGTGATPYPHPGTATLTPAQQQDRLWCSLLWQLRNGCLDDRQEIRQSATQTFFALVQTYGWRFSGPCWRCVLHDVLLPLMEVVAVATTLCATPAPQPTPTTEVPAAATIAGTSLSLTTGGVLLQDPTVQLLLKGFTEQPAQLEEARVTLYDAGSRLFVTHYANMQAALRSCAWTPAVDVRCDEAAGSPARPASSLSTSPTFCSTGNMDAAGEATRVLEALLQLCGDVCVVVRGTSGESSAVAAVHALHGLLVEIPGSHGLHPYGVHLAWRAMERLLFRGDTPGEGGEGPPLLLKTGGSAPPGDDGTTTAAAGSRAPSPATPALFAHTEVKQCTPAVVAAIVAAVCDSFRLQRIVTATAAAAAGNSSSGVCGRGDSLLLTAADRGVSACSSSSSSSPSGGVGGGGGFSSYFSGWVSKAGKPAAEAAAASTVVVAPGAGRSVMTSPETQYFTRLLFMLEAVTRCHAVVSSYYFPSKPQTTLLEGVAAVWPTLSSREARMLWGEVLLPAFPSAEALQRFVLRDVTAAKAASNEKTSVDASNTAAPDQLASLKAVLPPGSHPSYLSAVMDTMRSLLLLHMGIDAGSGDSSATPATAAGSTATSAEEDRTRLLFMAPSTVQVTGALLLLHLASPAALAGSPRAGGVPFTLPALFLQECDDLLQFTLWGPVLSRAPATTTFGSSGKEDEEGGGSGSGAFTLDGSLPVTAAAAAAARCRREGVATLCRVFERFLVSTSTVVRFLDASSSASAVTTITTTTVPQYVTAAVQSLDRLVDTLGEVVRLVVEQYDDVASATEAINVLSLASTAEGLALARVAKRSLALLQRWTETVSSIAGSSNNNNNNSGDGGAVAAPAEGGASLLRSSLLRHKGDDDQRGTSLPGEKRHGGDGGGDGGEAHASRSQLQDVVRASMEARNKAIMRQYMDNPNDASAGALLLDTLHDMLRVAEKDRGASESDGSGNAATRSLEQWDGVMPELLQLVACSSDEATRSAAAMAQEKETRQVLSSILIVLHERQKRQRQRGVSSAGAAAAAFRGGSNTGQAASRSPAAPSPSQQQLLQQQQGRVSAIEAEEAMSII
ncbi:C-terminal region of Mon2 protein [Lotmaria passim]